jgi:hypothetical protein
MGRRVTALAVVLMATLCASAAAAPVGSLERAGRTSACVHQGRVTRCNARFDLAGERFAADSLAFSPDGRNVYAAAGVLLSFARDPRTGALRQLGGAAGCLGPRLDGCAETPGLKDVDSVSVSPDGRDVYVADGGGAIAAFDRDPGNGALTQRPSPGGCLSGDGRQRCGSAQDLWEPRATVASSDGRFLYAAGGNANVVVAAERQGPDRVLAALPTPGGCVAAAPEQDGPGCQVARGLEFPYSLALSRDEANLYVGGDGAVTAYSRNPGDGTIAQLPGVTGCVTQAKVEGCARGHGPFGSTYDELLPSGDGVVALGDDSLLSFVRDRETGGLRQVRGRGGCLVRKRRHRRRDDGVPGCARGEGLQFATDLAATSDGRSVYVGTGFGQVSAFARGDDGALRQLRGDAGCLEIESPGAACGSTKTDPLLESVGASPDGRHVYVGSDRGILTYRRVTR